MAPTSSDDLKQVLPSAHTLVLDFRLEVEDRKFFRSFPLPPACSTSLPQPLKMQPLPKAP